MIVFTNHRAIRNYLKLKKVENVTSQKLEQIMTISEFNQKAIVINGYKNISSIEREIIFNSVVKNLKTEKVFNIDTNIFNFLSYSKYFFSFFREIEHEKISIDQISDADYYEDYRKHIDFLKTLFEKYRATMDSLKLIDDIFIPTLYQLNLPYIKSLEKIEFYFEGSISKFQIEIFNKVSEIIPLKVIFSRSKFYNKIDNLIGINLKQNNLYAIDWRNKKVLSSQKVGIPENVEIYGFKNRFSQIGFVKERIYFFHKIKGVPIDEIGVILLDESFSENLREFENSENSNLNFAMGTPISEEPIYKFLKGISLYFEDSENRENLFRKKRLLNNSEELENIYEKFSNIRFSKNISLQFRDLIVETSIYFKLDKKTFEKIMDILSSLSSQNVKSLDFRTLFSLFLREFENIKIDDFNGGKVTVLGLLETRGVNFKAVIILDFNDEVFPKKEEKDLFINSEIRKSVNLPLPEDREAIQKVHLEKVLQNSSFSAISFIDSETTKISRFFHDFDFRVVNYRESYETELIRIVLQQGESFEHWSQKVDIISANYKISEKPLSNSRLKRFLMCPRSFYFKEVENIKTHSTDKKIELDLGNLIHNILRDIYQNRDHYLNADDLTKDINSELDKALKSNREDQGLKENSIPDIYIKSWKERLKRFAKNEVERFRSGVRVYAVEKNLKIENYRGFHIDGRIDRVDILPNGQLLLIDYKLSNPYKFNNFFSGKDEHDFQLLFYYILLKENEENISTENLFYYNLSTGELIKNKRKDLEELHISLEEIIELEKENIVFQKNVKCDQYCDYKILCNEK